MNNFNPERFRILAVDDSPIIVQLVESTLGNAGFQMMTALSGEEALALIAEAGLPHLALVDINMPLGMDGFELCEKVLQFCDLPIIMLTAIDEPQTIIAAIEKYAEDYMTKPVSKGEMIARVRRVLRRIGHFAYELEAFTRVDAGLAVNFSQNLALVGRTEVTLTPTETKLLYILMRAGGELVSTEFMLRRLWPLDIETATEDRLRVYIHRLRSKIERDPADPYYVISRRRKGYSLITTD